MGPLFRFFEFEDRPSSDDLLAMPDKLLNKVFEVQEPWLTVDKRDHIHAKRILELSLFVQVIKHDLRNLTALQFKNDTHTRFV